MREDHFGPEVAQSYDDSLAEMFGPAAVDPAVGVLAGLAGDGRALEFAIGTGRIALPLAARGVEICGIELSEAMIEQLRPSREAAISRSRSAIWPALASGARSGWSTSFSTRLET